MTALSVNVNKIAVLRNSRGGSEPDVVRAARTCLQAGAHGITVHPRPDQRHIRSDDVLALAQLLEGEFAVSRQVCSTRRRDFWRNRLPEAVARLFSPLL